MRQQDYDTARSGDQPRSRSRCGRSRPGVTEKPEPHRGAARSALAMSSIRTAEPSRSRCSRGKQPARGGTAVVAETGAKVAKQWPRAQRRRRHQPPRTRGKTRRSPSRRLRPRAPQRRGVAVVVAGPRRVPTRNDLGHQRIVQAPGARDDVAGRACANGFFERQEARDQIRQPFRRIDIVGHDDRRS